MPIDTLATWHRLVKERDVAGLDALLDDEAVFHSPVVHKPQVGKALTQKYLAAPAEGGEPDPPEDGRATAGGPGLIDSMNGSPGRYLA